MQHGNKLKLLGVNLKLTIHVVERLGQRYSNERVLPKIIKINNQNVLYYEKGNWIKPGHIFKLLEDARSSLLGTKNFYTKERGLITTGKLGNYCISNDGYILTYVPKLNKGIKNESIKEGERITYKFIIEYLGIK